MDNNKRTRCWSTIVYPDSVASDWIDFLTDECIPCFISPLHNNDFNADGEKKKAHHHILFCFDGVKSYSQIKDICNRIKSVEPKMVNSTRGYARYLCHLDNPEKAQYDINNILSIGGLDYNDVICSVTDKYIAIKQMMTFCRESNIYCYADLLSYACDHEQSWFRVLCDSGTVVIKEYLKSLSWKVDYFKKR